MTISDKEWKEEPAHTVLLRQMGAIVSAHKLEREARRSGDYQPESRAKVVWQELKSKVIGIFIR